MTGPLHGVRIIELGGIGPVPFGGMMLSDLGAEVIRVEGIQAIREGSPKKPPFDIVGRGRRSIAIDLKKPEGVETLLRLVEGVDGIIEGFRPGVTERLGVGPDKCLARNPRLVYGRMTGWGQDGPYAQWAGHDINYIALAGALYPIGRGGEPPVAPLNLVGDNGGGGMLLALGVVAALFEASRSGRGQAVDAAMVDGAAVLTALFHGLLSAGHWSEERGTNFLDGGAPFYDVYETADEEYISVGAIEPQFYAELRRLAGLDDDGTWSRQFDRSQWPTLKDKIAAVFRTKTREEWCALMEHTDACFAPVLRLSEAPDHPHNVHRQTFVVVDEIRQPAPAPRFGRTKTFIQGPPPHPGQHTDEILSEASFTAEEITKMRQVGAVG